MSYSQVFGGGSINPSRRTYLSLVTAVDVDLQWPIEQQIGGDDVAADIIDVNATAPGLNVDFDDAKIVSTGFTSLFTNIGANTVTVRDSAGGTIISLAPGESWFIYLTDNSTAAGVWRTFQLGATVSVASASALAGAGLKAIATTLNQTIPPTLTAVTPVTWVDADRAQFTVWTGGVGIIDLPTAVSVGSDWFSIARNEGSGTLTLTPPAGTIDSQATLILNPGDSCIVVTDGTNFFTIGLGGSTTVGFDFVQIDVSGSGDFILSGVQLNRIAYQFIGTLTGNRKIVVPNTIQQYWIDNSTTGAFILEVATAAQITPIQIIQNNRAILYCDGVNVVDAETGTFTPPVGIGQGGTGAVTAAGARTNLGVPATTFDLIAGEGMAGGGDLSASPRTFDFDLASLAAAVPALGDFLAFQDIDNADANAKATVSDILDLAPSSQVVLLGSARIAIAFGADNVWTTISDGTLAAAGATAAIIRAFTQIGPTASAFASMSIHLRETGSGEATGFGNSASRAVAEDSAGLGAGSDTNDAYVLLDNNQDFDILRVQAGVGTEIHLGWIIGYVA